MRSVAWRLTRNHPGFNYRPLTGLYSPPGRMSRKLKTLYQYVQRLPGLRFWGYRRQKDWELQVHSHRMEAPGNIVT